MTGTPVLLADPPEARIDPPPVDVLSEVLRAVRLTGSVFFQGSFTEPWGVISPGRIYPESPLSRFRHFSIFHLIAAGGCEYLGANGDRQTISAGDILLLPFAQEHHLWSGEPERVANYDDILRQSAIEGVSTAHWGGGGPETRFVCGYIESAELMFTPLFRSLPPLLIERTGDDPLGQLLATLAEEILRLVERAVPGTQQLLGRMMELLFIEVLRRHVNRLPPTATGWFAALKDPIVGRALQAIHAAPAERWTIDALAETAGTSRTVLGERFRTLLGRPPMEYVASWRIQLAADLLRASGENVARIAHRVGYESEPAFSRAFKRLTGVAPSQWRAAES